jgi:hypothetical protein
MVFAALPEMLMDAWYRDQPDLATEYMKTLVEVGTPPIFPVLPGVAWEQLRNRQWPDRPIVPKSLERKPAEEQYNEYTSKAAVLIGKTFGWSPLRIEHAIRGTAGPAAGDALYTPETIEGILTSKEPVREAEAADLLIVSRLFQRGGRLGQEPKPIRDLYDLVEELQLAKNSNAQPEGIEKERTPEEEARWERRLQLEDAVNAVSSLLTARHLTVKTEDRRALTAQALAIAQEALAADKAEEIDRDRFEFLRDEAVIEKENRKLERQQRDELRQNPQ